MPRVFFAIPMPLAVRRTLVACREACVAHDTSWTGEKWVAPENLHVTLRFLGTLAEPDVERCIAEVTRVSGRTEPFRLRLDAVRAIPQRRSASLIWVAPSLVLLACALLLGLFLPDFLAGLIQRASGAAGVWP